MIDLSNLQMYLNFSTVYRLHLRPPSKHDKANDRRRRTNVIIIAVTAIFFFGWMPLNILNVATEFDSAGILRSFLGCVLLCQPCEGFLAFPFNLSLAYSLHREREVLVYCLLKLLGASNACLNPFLYGYLNENFRQEYRGVKKQCCQIPRL